MPAKTIVLALALVLANDSYWAKTFLDFTLSYHILTLSTGKKHHLFQCHETWAKDHYPLDGLYADKYNIQDIIDRGYSWRELLINAYLDHCLWSVWLNPRDGG